MLVFNIKMSMLYHKIQYDINLEYEQTSRMI